MNLDLTRLNSLTEKGEIPLRRSQSPYNAQTEYGVGNYPIDQSNAAEALTEGLEGIRKLQRVADGNKAELERARSVYIEYQHNIKTSSQLQTEITNGTRAGEDIYSLFLKACKVISLMTANSVFYSRIEEDVRAIYGQGLLDPLPLQIELQQTRERLTRLANTLNRETVPDAKARIQGAIKAHEDKIAELESLLA